MLEPIKVYVVVRNGVPVSAGTSLATEGGILLRVIQCDDDDTPADRAEADGLIEAAESECPNPLDW